MLDNLTGVKDIRECLPYFRMLFDAIQIGLIIADPGGELVYYNAAQSEIDRLRPEEALGRKMCEVYNFTPDSSPAMRVLRTGISIVNQVHSYRTRNGRLINASCTIYPLRNDAGGLLGVICYSQSYTTLAMQFQNVQKDKSLRSEAGVAHQTGLKESRYSFASLIGSNRALLEAVELARLVAGNSSAVMLVGETGVGKEIFAQSIHYGSPRAEHPYTAINCSAVPEALLEGILFGTVKGAFTGAMNKPGLFEVSDKGSVFLDEIDSMPVSLQSKLLRVLQEKRIRRVGDSRERVVDVRIISAVGRNPADLLKSGCLRPDFYYRLGVIKIFLPPLRERMEDLPLLVKHFLAKFSANQERQEPFVTSEAMSLLYAHDWPGNVRELEHVIEASISVIGQSLTLEAAHLRSACPDIAFNALDVPCAEPLAEAGAQKESCGRLSAVRREAEALAVINALRSSAGNRSMAARLLGISPQLMYYKMKQHRLKAGDYAPKI
ncbi:MAG: sigma 54-interacting transcriptional regulator [Deltaproteobacteria bacterium]|jgi:arginine utilization regulatory protein|nr:sigma 54-interacting transcriptional regulator [Deltaproteobacteria bacterium]